MLLKCSRRSWHCFTAGQFVTSNISTKLNLWQNSTIPSLVRDREWLTLIAFSFCDLQYDKLAPRFMRISSSTAFSFPIAQSPKYSNVWIFAIRGRAFVSPASLTRGHHPKSRCFKQELRQEISASVLSSKQIPSKMSVLSSLQEFKNTSTKVPLRKQHLRTLSTSNFLQRANKADLKALTAKKRCGY